MWSILNLYVGNCIEYHKRNTISRTSSTERIMLYQDETVNHHKSGTIAINAGECIFLSCLLFSPGSVWYCVSITTSVWCNCYKWLSMGGNKMIPQQGNSGIKWGFLGLDLWILTETSVCTILMWKLLALLYSYIGFNHLSYWYHIYLKPVDTLLAIVELIGNFGSLYRA